MAKFLKVTKKNIDVYISNKILCKQLSKFYGRVHFTQDNRELPLSEFV